jgi:hypothetical protein
MPLLKTEEMVYEHAQDEDRSANRYARIIAAVAIVGQTMTEYAIVLAVVGIAAIIADTLLGTEVATIVNSIIGCL